MSIFTIYSECTCSINERNRNHHVLNERRRVTVSAMSNPLKSFKLKDLTEFPI